jgi:hypothetical protein
MTPGFRGSGVPVVLFLHAQMSEQSISGVWALFSFYFHYLNLAM